MTTTDQQHSAGIRMIATNAAQQADARRLPASSTVEITTARLCTSVRAASTPSDPSSRIV